MTRVAITGAGLAGLTLARRLSGRARVTVFEKSGGVGGRMATRYAPPYEFDHGTQFFRARSQAFIDAVEEWKAEGVVASWDARFAELDRDRVLTIHEWDDADPHYVGTARMNRLGKHLAEGIDVRLDTRVQRLELRGDDWGLVAEDGADLGEFDWVVSTAPATQTAELLPASFAHRQAVRDTRMHGCYALMLGFRHRPPLDWQAALVRNADVSWISVNSSKPGRPAPFTLVAHSTNAFADARIDDDLDRVEAHLANELTAVAGVDANEADFRRLHRWRYANISQQSGAPALLDADQRLAACGDWCIHGRVEAAFTSACALGEMLEQAL